MVFLVGVSPLGCSSLFAQPKAPVTMNFTELFAQMQACQKDTFRLSNARIMLDPEKDRRFDDADSSYRENLDSIHIKCTVELKDIEFVSKTINLSKESAWEVDSWLRIQKISFEKSLWLERIKAPSLYLSECNFKGKVTFINGTVKLLSSENNHYHQGIDLWRMKVLEYLQFQSDLIYGNSSWVGLTVNGHTLIEKSTLANLKIDEAEFEQVLIQKNPEINALYIGYSKFKRFQSYRNMYSLLDSNALSFTHPFWFWESELSVCTFENDTFLNSSVRHGAMLSGLIIHEWLSVDSSSFAGPLSIRNVDVRGVFYLDSATNFHSGLFLVNFYFNEKSSIAFAPIKGNIYQSNLFGQRPENTKMSDYGDYGLLPSELRKSAYTENLLKSKRTFYNVYNTQGLSKNANEMLREIKYLETLLWREDYRQSGDIHDYFNWKMNAFLGTFSGYGTDPVQAILYSIRVILFFALLYIFFHNDWDTGSNNKLRKRLNFMLRYFKVPQGLAEVDKASRSTSSQELQALDTEMQQSSTKVPRFFRWFVNRYVKSSRVSESLRLKMLNTVDILKGTYGEQSGWRRFRISLLSGMWLVFYLLYFMLNRILNALTLSLNSFTTLGFGSIPTKGFSRYIVIIEGFLGWVLMTIFSATLITQLLQ